jgi:hypothetical protein
MSEDYLWDRRGTGDDFVRELEDRLAPLDEAVAILDQLELELEPDLDDRDEAVAVVVPLPAPRREVASDARRDRGGQSWPWLAAAVVLLGLSSSILIHDVRERTSSSGAVVEVGAATKVDGRVVVSLRGGEDRRAAQAALASLRPLHPALARCTLDLGLGLDASASFELRLGEGELGLDFPPGDAAEVETCVREVFADFDASEQLGAPVELLIRLHGEGAKP